MDLSTVLKKVKAFQYSSKEDFVVDLDLIWDNCLLYNSSPDSLYRVHAQKMRERAAIVLRKIPDTHPDSDGMRFPIQ